MTDQHADKPRPLNCDRDPQRWAMEFNHALNLQGIQPLDDGLMCAWFANAMMCGEDTYRWRQEEAARSATLPLGGEAAPMGMEEARRLWHRELGAEGSRCPTQSECIAFDDGFRWARSSSTAPASASVAFPTVRVEGQDKPPMAYLVVGSGEGSSDHRFCRTEAEVRQAYIDMVTGAYAGHEEEVDGFVTTFADEDEWEGNMLDVELYCARFEVIRFPAAALSTYTRPETLPFQQPQEK